MPIQGTILLVLNGRAGCALQIKVAEDREIFLILISVYKERTMMTLFGCAQFFKIISKGG